jgi:DNA polymerase-3 subunit epsilon
MYLIFDTETTGLPKRRDAPVSDIGNWPRLVQIAWARYDARDAHLGSEAHIVKPHGFVIPKEAERLHGISTERAMAEGVPLAEALANFSAAVAQSTIIVAHNMSFDRGVIGAEFVRAGIDTDLHQKRRVCTMTSATDLCRLPGPYGYRWPTLSELYLALFGKRMPDAHYAESDVRGCAQCFFELKRRGVIGLT